MWGLHAGNDTPSSKCVGTGAGRRGTGWPAERRCQNVWCPGARDQAEVLLPHPCVLLGRPEDSGQRDRASLGWSGSRGHSRASSPARVAARRGANEKWAERQRPQGHHGCSDGRRHRAARSFLPTRLFTALRPGHLRPLHSPPPASHLRAQAALGLEKEAV